MTFHYLFNMNLVMWLGIIVEEYLGSLKSLKIKPDS